MEYEYTVEDKSTGKYTLHFGGKVSVSALEVIIGEINKYHETNEELFSVI